MKVGVFTPGHGDRLHHETLRAFAEGAARTEDVFAAHVEDYRDCDVAVVFGVEKKAAPYTRHRGAIIARHRVAGKPVVVIDSGYVTRDRYFMVGLNGLNGRAEFRHEDVGDDGWRELGVSLAPWRPNRESGAPGHIVLCGQVPWDASVQHSDHVRWCRDAAKALRAATGRKIVFRPHPLAPQVDYGVAADEVSTRPLADDLDGAWAAVTFNSNCAVDAVIAGVPAIAIDEGSMAWDVADHSLWAVEQPRRGWREPWAHRLAYAQWTQAEMREGLPWRHLFGDSPSPSRRRAAGPSLSLKGRGIQEINA